MPGPYGRFARYYDAIYYDFVDYPGDCDQIERIFRRFRSRPRTILDLGCGTGTHALELTRRGYQVLGLDRSPSQLRVAREKAREAKLAVRLIRADMTRFRIGRTFDAAISRFGGFGYMLLDRELSSHFACVRRHLAPGGLYVFEFWQKSAARDRHQSWIHRRGPSEIIRLDESRVDQPRSRMTMTMQFFVLGKGRLADRFTEVHTVRLFTVSEVRTFADRAGFRTLGMYGEMAQKKGLFPIHEDTFHVTAIARA